MEHTRFLYTATAVCGGFSLAHEIIVGRLLAPFFGQSIVVWAGVISAVLLSIAFGSFIGGILVDRFHESFYAYGCIPVTGALISTLLVLPLYHSLQWIFAEVSLSFPIFVFILLFALAVFSLPVMIVSMLLPVITKTLSHNRENSGIIIGRVYAFNTLGSIVGAVSAAVLLIPILGITWSIYILNFILVILSAAFFFTGMSTVTRASAAYVLVSSFIVILSCIPWLFLTRITTNENMLYSSDTAYNYIRIYKERDAIIVAVNDPHFVQSIHYLDNKTRLDVWHLYLLAPEITGLKKKGRVLFLGYGSGSAATLYRKWYPDYELTGVEIDPCMVKAGHEYLSDTSGATIIIGDARSALYQMEKKFDIIISDVFRFPYMPHHTTTVEFFRLVRNKLAPGGILLYNAGRYDRDDTITRGIASSIQQSFKDVRLCPVGRFNTIIFATDRAYNLKAIIAHNKENEMLLRYATNQTTVLVHSPSDKPFVDDLPISEHLTHLMGFRYLASEAYQ